MVINPRLIYCTGEDILEKVVNDSHIIELNGKVNELSGWMDDPYNSTRCHVLSKFLRAFPASIPYGFDTWEEGRVLKEYISAFMAFIPKAATVEIAELEALTDFRKVYLKEGRPLFFNNGKIYNDPVDFISMSFYWTNQKDVLLFGDTVGVLPITPITCFWPYEIASVNGKWVEVKLLDKLE